MSSWPPKGYSSGTAYLQVRAGRYVSDLKVVKSTQRKPEIVEPGCVVVKIELRVPRAAFQPLKPSAIVTVPEELVQHVVEAEAVGDE
ncbi:hypothetical protein BAY59_10905 [Prauserella coralliicola]|nr:hypothetical protein BAY59_10905 [Prauserella coralliicola]